jgi:hypothetical protein
MDSIMSRACMKVMDLAPVLAWRSWSLINLMPCVPLEKRVTA